jgi:hypothetical protein
VFRNVVLVFFSAAPVFCVKELSSVRPVFGYPDKTSGDITSGAIKRPVTKRPSLNVRSYITSGVKTSVATKRPEL